MAFHLIDRTSPKGGPFLGTCRYCGKTDLPPSAVAERCPSSPLDEAQRLLDALETELHLPLSEKER